MHKQDPDLVLTLLYSTALDTLYRFMKLFGFSFDGLRDIGPACVAKQALGYLQTVCCSQVRSITVSRGRVCSDAAIKV